jgi:hypothetical protein
LFLSSRWRGEPLGTVKLKKEESSAEFAKRIRHVLTVDPTTKDKVITRVALASLERLLVEKGILTRLELQQALIDEAERAGFYVGD